MQSDRDVGGEGRNGKSFAKIIDTHPTEIRKEESPPDTGRAYLVPEVERSGIRFRMHMKGKMEQGELFEQIDDLFDQLCDKQTLSEAFRAVKRNGGSPGVDGVDIPTFEMQLKEEIARLQAELRSWSYKPRPVRRVEIPKPTGGVRQLGVPCVRDRVVQGAIKQLLEPMFDPQFSESSYGFRPGRNQRQAVEAAQRYVAEGKGYVVDLDLSKFFDRINHDRLLWRVKQTMDDKRIIKLIGMILRSGVSTGETIERTADGTTQGSPLSPLLSNIVLDELDKELEARGLSFCRYADDVIIFVGSQKAAYRVMESVTNLLERRMKLPVNRQKTKVARAGQVAFLGMTVFPNRVVISRQSLERAKAKIRELTPRRSGRTIEQAIERFNRWYRGWATYYEMTNNPNQLQQLEARARHRFRAQLLRNLKRKRNYARALRRAHLNPASAFKNRGWWAMSNQFPATRLYSNAWFYQRGLYVKSTETHDHWSPIKTR